MALKLNRVQKYREFYGRNIDQMPLLVADRRTPLSVEGLIDLRFEALALEDGVDDEFKAAYVNNYFDTGDAVLYHPDGRIKIVYDSQALREMNSDSKLVDGALVLGNDAYDVEGWEFKPSELANMANGRALTLQEARTHPLWQVLARGKQDKLDNYTGRIFKAAKERFGYDQNMGIYLGSATKEKVTVRSWYVIRLDDRSSADGGDNLDSSCGRLVGVATESQSGAKK